MDNRTEAERRYDALKDGSAYIKLSQPGNLFSTSLTTR